MIKNFFKLTLTLTLTCGADLQGQHQNQEVLLRPTQHFLYHRSMSSRSRDMVT